VWADGNHDGFLSMGECEQLVAATLRFFAEPHRVANELDSFLDANLDGGIGPDEIDRAWLEVVLPRLERILPLSPEAARFVDVNDNGVVEPDERRLAAEYLQDHRSLEPHPAVSPIDARVDANHDGRVGTDEIAAVREQLVRAAVLAPMDAGPPRFLDELADVNGNGILDPEEVRQREAALAGPHGVASEIDRRLDASGNGRVEQG
jgi:hypothetical protein